MGLTAFRVRPRYFVVCRNARLGFVAAAVEQEKFRGKKILTGFPPKPSFSHHQSHAAVVFFQSQFEDALVGAAQVPAVVHGDGTSRIQTVRKETNSLYHELISSFSKPGYSIQRFTEGFSHRTREVGHDEAHLRGRQTARAAIQAATISRPTVSRASSTLAAVISHASNMCR